VLVAPVTSPVDFLSANLERVTPGDAENARHETTGKETTAPKYPKMQGVETARNGNCGTMLQGVENARHEYSGKAEYRKPSVVKYR